MRYLIFTLIVCLVLTTAAYSQGKNNSLKEIPFKERIVTGGGFGLGFGSYQDFISLSPVIGYAITKKLIAGTGVTFRYTNYKYYSPSVALIDYAVNPFARFTVYRGIFLYSELEYLNYESVVYPTTETVRLNFTSFLSGAGIIQPIGDRAAMYVMALYNFSYIPTSSNTVYAPYDSPLVIRAGINLGGFLAY